MAVDRFGTWRTGSKPGNIEEYPAAFSADGYPVQTVRHARCATCGSRELRLTVDDDEGCAERTCTGCGSRTAMLDSGEHADDADLQPAGCPCGGEVFNGAVGFATYPDSEDIRWVYVGLRCVRDGVLGVYADWKIDYSPSSHPYDAAERSRAGGGSGRV